MTAFDGRMGELGLLQFEPVLREYLWGGRRLAELGKPIGNGPHYAESWEVVDHGDDQSRVAHGALAGATLHKLVTQHGRALLRRHHPQRQFPLLFKFLDCQQTLSVQVHPNDAQAAKLDPPDLGKTEAWVVLAAEPGSKVYAGLKQGVDRATLERSIAAGHCEECLHEFEPAAGDCIFIEAGTVHALGAGLLIAEIQQASDTTYRLYDWNRVDRDGKPRPLHVAQGLATIDFARGPVNSAKPKATDRPNVERMVACDKFVLDRWRVAARDTLKSDNRFHILAVIDGNVTASANGDALAMRRGDTLLVPACCNEVELTSADGVLLDMYLP